eukprot:jgi/Botrbrau1/2000/Bobra.0052s0041.1
MGQQGALALMARRIMAPRLAQTIRGGGGGPVPFRGPANAPLPEEAELLWEDGSAYPEFCLDQFTLWSEGQALGALLGALGFFVGLGVWASWDNKAARVPFAPRDYPYDNLSEELGGKGGTGPRAGGQ